jgi:hypothetical protein
VSRLVVFPFVAAAVVFCVVQDRVTAAGVHRYVTLQRAAGAAREVPPTLDEVMTPANRRAVEQGLLWSGVAGGVTAGAGAVMARRRRRE